MLTVSCLGACPSGDPNALVKKLTGIKVGPIQPIDDATAQGIADELAATVRCNAEEAARKVIVPAVIISGIAAIAAGVFAWRAMRHPEMLGESVHRRRRRRSRR